MITSHVDFPEFAAGCLHQAAEGSELARVAAEPLPCGAQANTQIKLLENRLEKEYHTHSGANTYNFNLRVQARKQYGCQPNVHRRPHGHEAGTDMLTQSALPQIEDLRRERLVFDDFHRKLEAQLAEQQREEVALIETIHQFHQQRCKVIRL